MMRKRNLFLVLFVSLAFTSACAATTDDPSQVNNGSTNNSTANNSSTNNSSENNSTTNNGSENNSAINNSTTNNSSENNNPSNNNNSQPAECTPNLVFSGQVGYTGEHDGGTFSTDPLTVDAGLQELHDAIEPASNDDEAQVFETAIEVRGATVIATTYDRFANTRFWVQDANAGMQFYLPADGDGNPTNEAMAGVHIKVGQIVNFDVTEVQIFNGHAQVSDVSFFEVESEGNPVPVVEIGDADVTMDHYYKNVRVNGTLGPNITECGGQNKCYDIIYGDSGAKSVMLRSSSQFLEAGKCVTFVGPVGAFPGPKNPDGNQPVPQLESVNFNWLYSPNL